MSLSASTLQELALGEAVPKSTVGLVKAPQLADHLATNKQVADLAVYVSAVAELDDQDAQRPILNVANHAKIPYSITPQATQWAGESFPRTARVSPAGNPFIQEIKNTFGRLLVELA